MFVVSRSTAPEDPQLQRIHSSRGSTAPEDPKTNAAAFRVFYTRHATKSTLDVTFDVATKSRLKVP